MKVNFKKIQTKTVYVAAVMISYPIIRAIRVVNDVSTFIEGFKNA